MTDKDHRADDILEGLFEQARATPPEVPDALMARVLADAQAVQPTAQSSRWRDWLAVFGGLPALGGLVTATCVGFWIGLAPPAGLPDLGAAVFGVQSASDDGFESIAMTGFGWDIEEEL
jgi:hypothetical protein